MAEFLEIRGAKPLRGIVPISGAKNAALPILMATLLTGEECEITNVPNLEDVNITLSILEQFGAEISYRNGNVKLKVPVIRQHEASYALVKTLRASFWLLGPLLARTGVARVALPGGDPIGTRPVDMHLRGLTAMGADIQIKHGVVLASAPKGLRPAKIELPFPSVGATHQLMMAASLVVGTTIIKGAAREPEVGCLAEFLSSMGARIEGAGSSEIIVHGKAELGSGNVRLIGDRIEAGTYLLAGVATGGQITASGVTPAHLGNFLEILSAAGVNVATDGDAVTVSQSELMRPVNIKTDPFPGFATDLQAQMVATLSLVAGVSTVEETVFESRFAHVSELNRLGASIQVADRLLTISGVKKFSGAPVECYDIRGAVALVIAGLAAEGVTNVYGLHHLRRGYERLIPKLLGIGASVIWMPGELEDSLAIGC